MFHETAPDPLWRKYQRLHSDYPDPAAPQKIDFYRDNSGMIEMANTQTHPLGSIVVVAYNEEKLLPRALCSINRALKKTFKNTPEVIVVDNNSTDATKDICKEFKVKRIFESTKGIASARQAGLEAATNTSTTIYSTDSDCVVPDYWILKYLQKMKNPGIMMACGLTRYVHDQVTSCYDNSLLSIINILATLNRSIKISSKKSCFATSGNLAFNRSGALSVGGYDVRLKRGEDYDLMMKMNSCGEILAVPQLVVLNSSRRFTGEGMVKNTMRRVFNNVNFYLTGNGPMGSKYADYR